jgi:hypothetical protein
MRSTLYKVFLAGGIGAVIGICGEYLAFRGKITVLGWPFSMRIEFFAGILGAFIVGVLLFWGLPVLVSRLLRYLFK